MIRSWRIQYVLVMSTLLFVTIGYNACSNDASFDLRSGVNSIEEYGSETETDTPEVPTALDPKIIINNGSEYTTENAVTLSLDPGGPADQMFISNSADCSVGSWEPYKQNKAWTLASSNSESSVFAKYSFEDSLETPCVSDSIIHDDIPPVVSFTQGVGSLWVTEQNLSIQFQAMDSGSGLKRMQCLNSGSGNYQDCGGNIYYSGLVENQPYQLVVRAEDKAGNMSGPQALNWRGDFSAPVVAFNQVPASITSDVTPNFAFSGSDLGSGLAGYEYQVDGGDWIACDAACASALELSNLAEGPHILSIRGTDNVGFVSEVVSHPWVQDATAPTVEYTRVPNRYSNSPAAVFEFQEAGSDNEITGFYCSLNGVAATLCTSPKTETGLIDGEYTYSVFGVDAAMNQSAPVVYRWTVDTVNPTIAIVDKPLNPTQSTNATFSFIDSDDRSGVERIECRLDANPYATCMNTESFANLSNGPHSLDVRAIDRAGNTSTVTSYQWTVDSVIPTVQIDSGPDNPTNLSAGNFTFSGDDGTGGSGINYYECKVDGGNYSLCTSPYMTADLADGEHIFSVRARDNAGNYSTAANYSWVIDTVAPVINLVFQPNDIQYIGTTAQINFFADDGTQGSGVSHYACLYQGNAYSCDERVTYAFPATVVGDFIFQIIAYDNVGNASAPTILNWETRQANQMVQTIYPIANGRPVDIIMIVDNSISMDDERFEIGNKIQNLFTELIGLDWQLAMITTDVEGDRDYQDGKLLKLDDNGTYFITPQTDPAYGQQILSNTINQIPAAFYGWNYSIDEQGIWSAKRAIERSDMNSPDYQAINAQFFRENASIEFIVISDEDEHSDGSGIRLSPDGFISYAAQAFEEPKNLAWHSIVDPPNSDYCTGDFNREAFVYADLSEKTNGVLGNICASSYDSVLQQIGSTVVDNQRSFLLECAPLDADGDNLPDILVESGSAANDEFVPYGGSYTVSGQQVRFDNNLPPADYRFTYECPVTGSP